MKYSKIDFKIGQKITFKSATRSGYAKATRLINGSWCGLPTVRFHGWSNFVIKEDEIIEINDNN
jgi:hypothetical protein